MSESKDPNRLFERVDALMRRQQEDSRRAVEEVPLLTDVVEREAAAQAAHDASVEEALAADIERVLVVRLVPELNRQIAALRAELEKELRRAVREAVAHALESRKTDPEKS